MKPFNLEKALAGEPVVNRIGMKVTEIVHFKTATNQHPVVYIADGKTYSVDPDGRCFSCGIESSLDLFMVPKMVKMSGWINIYPDGATSGIYQSRDDAVYAQIDHGWSNKRIACIEITWEEEER